MARKSAAGASGILLLVLIGLVGVGGWNYYTNWQREQQEQGPRPFASYADADLEALAEAYRSEIEGLQQLDASARARRRDAADSPFMHERVAEFERIKRTSERIRNVTGEIAEREARLRELEQEIAYRKRLAGGLEVHLHRLTGF
jgi:hypothetical protein